MKSIAAMKRRYLAEQIRLAAPFAKRGGPSIALAECRIAEARRVVHLNATAFLDYVAGWQPLQPAGGGPALKS